MKMKRHRLMSLALGMLMTATLLAGCGQSSSTDTSDAAATAETSTTKQTDGTAAEVDYSNNLTTDGKTIIRVAIDADPGTFDPAMFGSGPALDATQHWMREGLFEMSETGELIPELAKSYTVDDDNLTYHVELYDYIYDSEGNHITADDVAFCYMRAKQKAFNATAFYDTVTKDDDYNVTIKLNDTSVGVFAQVTQMMKIYSQKAFEEIGEENFGSHPVFTGRYILTDWQVGSSLTFELNDQYWQKEELRHVYAQDNVDVIQCVIIKESAQQAIGIETGELDMVSSMAPIEAARFMEGGTSSEGIIVEPYTQEVTQLMLLNDSKLSPLYDNVELRKAIMYAIDIDGLIDGTCDGNAVASKTFGNANIPEYLTEWDSENYFDYDPEYAKECLAKSNYTTSTVLRLVTGNSELQVSMAQIIQAYLLDVGIQTEILTYEDTMFRTYKIDPTAWDILLDKAGWNGVITTKWRDEFSSFGADYRSITFTEDPVFFELLEAAMDVSTYSADTVDAFHQYLIDQAYCRGLFNQTSYAVASDVVTEIFKHRSGSLFPPGCTYAWSQETK